MILSTIKTLLRVLWIILRLPLIAFGILLAVFGLACLVQFGQLYFIKGYRLKRGQHFTVKKKSFFKRLFWDAPRRVALDAYERDPEFFRYQGLHIFCGEQGSGKTIALVEWMMRIQKEYPKCKCMTNLDYAYENDELKDWRQLLTYTNGKKGVLVAIDELQNWFASGMNTLPPGMLEVATQNRKNRRMILGTSQVFTRLAKGLREQATLIYLPITFAGAVTWVRVKKPVLDADGNVKELKHRGSYFFVHTPELREAYDTYKVIHSLAQSGFKEQPMEVNQRTVIDLRGAKFK